MKINKCVLGEIIFLNVLSVSCFMMISCGEDNPCSNIKNGVSYKKKGTYDVIDKFNKKDFIDNYHTQYDELIEKIKDLYEVYEIVEGEDENSEEQDDENEKIFKKGIYSIPPDGFIEKVRGIVEKNKGIYEETYKQIDKYTHKIPQMPWAFGCTIKGLVMYILHNPIIKCAVQYFDNYKNIYDETFRTFDQMVTPPTKPIDEWHNCLVTFIRLLKLTYLELESNITDDKVHGKLWNQIQGLEYLLHFLCFGFRRGHFDVSKTINFLKVFLNILGVFDFSEQPVMFGLDRKNLKHSAYCCWENGFQSQNFFPQYVSKKYLDSICCRDKHEFLKNILYIISKSNRANWMIVHREGNHFFHFYLCKKAGSGIKKNNGEYNKPVVEKVYYIHDGWYEYQDFIKKIAPQKEQEFLYYSIPFTYIILPKEAFVEQPQVININNCFEKYGCSIQLWDSLIPLLSTDLNLVKECSKKLYTNFEYFNKNDEKFLFRNFLRCLVDFISSIVRTYKNFKLDKKPEELKFYYAIKDLLSFEVDGGVLHKGEKNIDIAKIKNYYYEKKKEINEKYPDKENKGKKVENKEKVQPMLQLLMETINKMRWFLKKDDVVDLILGYNDVIYKTEEEVAFVEKTLENIPEEIREMFEEWVKKYLSHIGKTGKNFVFEKLVHGNNNANNCYDRAGKYKQADVLKVDWTKTGLSKEDLPIFRKKFEKYKFFESAQFSDVVK